MKPIWKLIVKCVCAVMPFIILGCGINRDMLALVDGEAPYYIWNREKTNTKQDKRYRVVVLGDSTANASYVPEALSRDTINLSLGGTSPMENYYTLQDWLAHNPAPDACYISFVDGHFLGSECFWTRSMFSHRYSLKQDVEMLRAASFYQEPSILEDQYRFDFVSSQMYLPKKYITSVWDTTFYKIYEQNSNSMRADELHGGRYIARGTNEYNAGDPRVFDEFHVNPLFDEYYRKTIELCLENGITPRIVKLPLPDDSEFTDNYVKTFREYYDSLQEAYPALTVDWSTKVYPKAFFADGAHMNSHGALQFSTELKERYPEDFSTTELDEGQIAALDDSIRGENKIKWILKWISGKDYTVLFYDKRGDFDDVYKKQIQDEGGAECSHLISVPIDEAATMAEGVAAMGDGDGNGIQDMDATTVVDQRKADVWAVSGTGKGVCDAISVSLAENGLSLQLEGKEPQQWATASDDMLGVAVVNNYNNAIVCMKTFMYVDGELQLFE